MGKAYTSAAKRARVGAVPQGTPAEVLEWVGDDLERARAALAAMRAQLSPEGGWDEQQTAERAQLTVALEQVLPSFDLDGVRFTARGTMTLLDLCEFARSADLETASPAGMAAMAEFYEALLGRVEYQRFRKHCRDVDADDEILMEIMLDLVGEFTARPTKRPSPSADGPRSTSPTSKVVSLSHGSVTERPMTPEEFATWAARHMQELTSSNSTPDLA